MGSRPWLLHPHTEQIMYAQYIALVLLLFAVQGIHLGSPPHSGEARSSDPETPSCLMNGETHKQGAWWICSTEENCFVCTCTVVGITFKKKGGYEKVTKVQRRKFDCEKGESCIEPEEDGGGI